MHRDRAIEPSRAFVELGSRLSRDTFLYTFGTSLTLPVSVLTTAFLTRHFTTGDFGQLAVLFASAGLLTVALNFVFLQGALLLVFVNADVGVELDWATAEVAERNERPIVLTTGLCMTAAIGAVTTLLIWLFSPQLSELLLHNNHGETAVTLAGASAAAGAMFRYTSNVTRFERRPSTYSTAAASRPLVALVVTVALVLADVGLAAPLVGTAMGSLVASTIAVTVSRRSYGFKVTWGAIKRAFRVGLPWVPVVTGLFVAHSADLLFLRTTASNTELGIYRIADGLSSIISYAVSAFHLAQVPLEGTLTVQSAYQEHTRDRVMATYVLGYLITAFALLLLLTVGGEIAVAVIAPGYEKAVPLIPITSLAYVGYGFLLVCFRAGDYYANRVRAYAVTATTAGVLVAVLALTLLHVIGIGGAPTGAAIGCFGTAIALLVLGHVFKHPLPLDYRRVFGVVALTAACWALGTQVGTGHDMTGVLARIAALVLYPLGLVMFRIIPREITPQMPRMFRGMLPKRARPSALLDRVLMLPRLQRDALVAAARDRLGASEGAQRLGTSEETYLTALAGGLRRLAGGNGEFLLDEDLARYLIADVPPADRDEMLRELHHRRVNMLEFRAMERVFISLRAAPRGAWSSAALTRYRPPPPPPGESYTGVLEELVSGDWDIAAVAHAAGTTETAIRRGLVAQLREMANCGSPGPADQLVGQYLLDRDSVPSTSQLWAAGVDPTELHRLDVALMSVRQHTKKEHDERHRAAQPATSSRLRRLFSPKVSPIPRDRPGRVALLDPLRALAALLVVGYHLQRYWGASKGHVPNTWPKDSGALGVAIFFLIAGWVIYRPFIAARRNGERVDVPAYALRRVVRITPAYWLALIGAVFLLTPGSDLQSIHFVRYAAFGQIYVARDYLRGMGQAWTLDIEILFYILVPLLAVVLGRVLWRWSSRAELAVLAAMVAITVALRLIDPYALWVNGLPGYLAYFALGMLLARLSVSRDRRVLRFGQLASSGKGMITIWLAAVLLYLGFAERLPPAFVRGKVFIVPFHPLVQFLALGAVALLVVLPALGARPLRTPAGRTAAWLGERSYGIYLWHLPLIVFVASHVHNVYAYLAICVVGAISIAALSWRLVESPLNSWASGVGRRRAAKAAAEVEVPPASAPAPAREAQPVGG